MVQSNRLLLILIQQPTANRNRAYPVEPTANPNRVVQVQSKSSDQLLKFSTLNLYNYTFAASRDIT